MSEDRLKDSSSRDEIPPDDEWKLLCVPSEASIRLGHPLAATCSEKVALFQLIAII